MRHEYFGSEIGHSSNRAIIVPYDDKVKEKIEPADVARRLGKWTDWLAKFHREEKDLAKLKETLSVMRSLRHLTIKENEA